MDIIVGTYVANTNENSPYFGKPGLVIAEARVLDAETRVRVAWIDTPTNVTVREPVTRILTAWEGDTPPAVDADVIDAAVTSYLSW